MYRHHAKYVDFNGNEREEDFYFNLTEAEISIMDMEVVGGFPALVERIVAAQDSKALIGLFQDLIKRSYGVKTPDGKGFDKSDRVVAEFLQTQAYSDLFMKLARDAKFAADFFNGVIPAKVKAASGNPEYKVETPSGPIVIPAPFAE